MITDGVIIEGGRTKRDSGVEGGELDNYMVLYFLRGVRAVIGQANAA